MTRITANGIAIEYESFGDAGNDTILLIMGLGTQLTAWPDTFCEKLVNSGYRVIRFDNRDIGLSTHLTDAPTPNIPLLAGLRMLRLLPPVPYTLDDMSEDAIGLLDVLGIERAHVVGASMGGMIAQLLAARFPQRTLSLTSIMSTTGNRALPRANRQATRALLIKPDDPLDPQSVIARNVTVRKAVQSPVYPKSQEELYAAAAGAFHRGGYDPAGVARQLAAVIVSGDRRRLLRRITVPSLVMHGDADPLVKVACGVDTARNLAGATLKIFPGMGHDFPEPLLEAMAEEIHRIAVKAA
ncbi:MAG: alpha/beta fold hydrolase [Chromatocurvus sp.]